MTDKQKFLEIYREHRDEVRASIKALGQIHGEEAVCVALHVCNLTRLGGAFIPEGEVRTEFNNQLGLLANHAAKPLGKTRADIAAIAGGIWEQMAGFKTALQEAGFGDQPFLLPEGGHDDS